MSNGKDDGIIEKGKDVIDKVSGAIDETIPNETPDVKPDHTGTQDDVQKLINEVPQGQQAACRESCKKQEKTRTWRVWDWKLEKSLGQDFEGEIVLKWECDCCYIYKVRAWHHTTINTVPVVPNLKVKTSPADPGPLRLTGCAPCKPVGMRVELHLTLGEKSGLGKLAIVNPPLRSYHIEVLLPAPCGDALDKEEQYKSQVSSDDWDKIHATAGGLKDVGQRGIYPSSDPPPSK